MILKTTLHIIIFSRHGGVGLTIGLDDLRGLSQPMILWFIKDVAPFWYRWYTPTNGVEIKVFFDVYFKKIRWKQRNYSSVASCTLLAFLNFINTSFQAWVGISEIRVYGLFSCLFTVGLSILSLMKLLWISVQEQIAQNWGLMTYTMNKQGMCGSQRWDF